MSTHRRTKKVVVETKTLIEGKSPEIRVLPGSSSDSPGAAMPSTPALDFPRIISYQSTSTSVSKENPKLQLAAGSSGGVSTSILTPVSPGGYQSSTGPQGPSQNEEPQEKKSSLSRQIFLGMVIALPSVPCGMSLAFSSVSLETLDLTVDEASWYASVTFVSYPVGSLVVGKLMDQYGRKPALLSITIMSLIGWLMLSVPAADVSLAKLLIGRILTGIAGGLASVPAAVYAAECLCPNNVKIRSSLVTWSTVALSIGIFLVFMTGAFLDYHNVASIATLISLAALVLVAIFIPESPVWLNLKGRHGDAEWSEREIAIAPPPPHMEDPSASEWEEAPQNSPPPPPPETVTFKEMAKPEVYKPLLIMIGFFFFQQFSGVYVVIAYMDDIIRAAGVVTVSANWLALVDGAVIVSVSIIASIVYPKTGVRAVAAFSSVGTAITMFWIGIYLSVRPLWVGNSSWYFLHWLPVFLIISNIALSTAGFLILPWSMLGEVFPLSVKGVAAGLATCIGFIFSFVALKLYPFIQLGLGNAEVFYFFGSMALLGTIFVVAFLPETHGKTLQEIIDGFTKKKAKLGKTSQKQSQPDVKPPDNQKPEDKKSGSKKSGLFIKAEVQV